MDDEEKWYKMSSHICMSLNTLPPIIFYKIGSTLTRPQAHMTRSQWQIGANSTSVQMSRKPCLFCGCALPFPSLIYCVKKETVVYVVCLVRSYQT
jgi:hypothetical protein